MSQNFYCSVPFNGPRHEETELARAYLEWHRRSKKILLERQERQKNDRRASECPADFAALLNHHFAVVTPRPQPHMSKQNLAIMAMAHQFGDLRYDYND